MNNQQIPILVISLARAPKRRKFIREQMAKLKIDYEFFDAVDGNKLSHAYISKFKVKEGEQYIGRPLSKGELGCAFSHLHIYEKMLAENIEKLIVLEDDIQLNDDFAALINNLNSAPLQWDLTYIGYWTALADAPLFGKNIYPLNLWENRALPIPPAASSTKYRIGPPIVSLLGSYAYAITKKGAEQLIQAIKSAPLIPADERLSMPGLKQRFAIAPITVKHWSGNNIEQHIDPDRSLLYKDPEPRSDFKHRISEFIIKSLQKIHPHASKYWHAGKVFRRRIKSTLRLIRSNKKPSHPHIPSEQVNNQQIPVLVISLARAPKRREFIREQLARLKIDYEFFDAVDGNKLSGTYISKFKVKKGEQCIGRSLTIGELGCAFSHLHVYEKMLAENIEKLIVLEDDAQLDDDFAALINGIDNTPVQWDLVYIGYWATSKDVPLFGKNIYPLSLWESRVLLLPAAASSIKYRIGPPVASLEGSHAYAITQNGAKRLIKQIKNNPLLPSDVRLETNNLKQRFAIAPIAIKQWRDDSIEQHIITDRNLAYGGMKQRSDLKYRISEFITKSLQKVHPSASEYWQAAKALRRRIISTLRLIRSKKFSYDDVL